MKAKNKRIRIGTAECDCAVFGSGSKNLIILPGAGDAFRTVKGMALPLALMYRRFANAYRVWFVSRRYQMPEGFTTADMADDLTELMQAEGISCADIFGVSQGGMIAQQLALRHPETVGRLVLAVTSARMLPVTQKAIGNWLEWSDQKNWQRIMQDTAERSYTGEYLRKNKLMLKLVNRMTKPAEPNRAEIIFRSCLSHDVLDRLGSITCPTLVIGAECDRIVGAEASRQIAGQIRGCELIMYEKYSHGVYDEAADFYDRVYEWLTQPERSSTDA